MEEEHKARDGARNREGMAENLLSVTNCDTIGSTKALTFLKLKDSAYSIIVWSKSSSQTMLTI